LYRYTPHEQEIIESVSGYFAHGLRFGEACVMAGTDTHNRDKQG
jgi:hypothetical protein